MAEDDNNDDYKITLAQQVFGKAAAIISGRNTPELNEVSDAKIPPVAPRDSPVSETLPSGAADLGPIEGAVQQRELKTAAELAGMIERDLAGHPDCPKDGFRVTVYGGSHRRAMLTITPAAGGVGNPQNGETSPRTSLNGFASDTIWLGSSAARHLKFHACASSVSR